MLVSGENLRIISVEIQHFPVCLKTIGSNFAIFRQESSGKTWGIAVGSQLDVSILPKGSKFEGLRTFDL